MIGICQNKNNTEAYIVLQRSRMPNGNVRTRDGDIIFRYPNLKAGYKDGMDAITIIAYINERLDLLKEIEKIVGTTADYEEIERLLTEANEK